mmetsp:Transcript_5635/g.12768  ORF Transcript_5635/g.12768 Transcript_5635/m.12768 type:complete len:83 (+) Transcript_5635:245-493(+)
MRPMPVLGLEPGHFKQCAQLLGAGRLSAPPGPRNVEVVSRDRGEAEEGEEENAKPEDARTPDEEEGPAPYGLAQARRYLCPK